MRKFLSFWKDILTLNIGENEELKGTVAFAFWAAMVCLNLWALFSAGTAAYSPQNRCEVTRLIQLNPTYLVACTFLGAKPPQFKIDWSR